MRDNIFLNKNGRANSLLEKCANNKHIHSRNRRVFNHYLGDCVFGLHRILIFEYFTQYLEIDFVACLCELNWLQVYRCCSNLDKVHTFSDCCTEEPLVRFQLIFIEKRNWEEESACVFVPIFQLSWIRTNTFCCCPFSKLFGDGAWKCGEEKENLNNLGSYWKLQNSLVGYKVATNVTKHNMRLMYLSSLWLESRWEYSIQRNGYIIVAILRKLCFVALIFADIPWLYSKMEERDWAKGQTRHKKQFVRFYLLNNEYYFNIS